MSRHCPTSWSLLRIPRCRADERPVRSFLDGKAAAENHAYNYGIISRHDPLIRPCYLVSVLITLKLLIAWLDYYRRLAMLVQIPEGGAHDTSECVGHWMPLPDHFSVHPLSYGCFANKDRAGLRQGSFNFNTHGMHVTSTYHYIYQWL